MVCNCTFLWISFVQFLGIDAFEMHLFVFMKQSCNKVESRPIDFSGTLARYGPRKIYKNSFLACGAMVVVQPDTVVFASIILPFNFS
jgi:hypothetical protein